LHNKYNHQITGFLLYRMYFALLLCILESEGKQSLLRPDRMNASFWFSIMFMRWMELMKCSASWKVFHISVVCHTDCKSSNRTREALCLPLRCGYCSCDQRGKNRQAILCGGKA